MVIGGIMNILKEYWKKYLRATVGIGLFAVLIFFLISGLIEIEISETNILIAYYFGVGIGLLLSAWHFLYCKCIEKKWSK